LKAIFINEDNSCPALWADIASGRAQLVYVSPEMVLSISFRNLWKEASFRKRVNAVIIDEAHCIDEWGGDDFRPQYRKIDELRMYTGQDVPFVACTATAATSTFEVIWKTLGFGSRPFWGLDVGCVRNNLTFIMRPLHYTAHPIFDIINTILPLILDANTKPGDIDKSLLYFDSERACGEAVGIITKILPPHLRGIVKAYSSTISVRGKTAIWDNFKSGQLRIICATDAAGMGCNVPDIRHTVVFGIPQCPKSISTVIQRWGRAARDRSIHGTCQLLLPEWAFHPAPVQSLMAAQKDEPKRNKKQREGLQVALERFINVHVDDPQGRLLSFVCA
jgi:superfamily II DNA helicase RecQ